MFIVIGIAVFWTLLTVWANYAGPVRTEVIGEDGGSKRALLVYNPDPIYNLDEQVCAAFARGLATSGFRSSVYTLNQDLPNPSEFDLVVVCANTYNWSPDWKTASFAKNAAFGENQPVVAITLGSGSTSRAQRLLENRLTARKIRLIGSRSLWLMRPNDESRMEEKNTVVACSLTEAWARELTAAEGW